MFFSIEREGEGCGDDDKAISLSNRLRIIDDFHFKHFWAASSLSLTPFFIFFIFGVRAKSKCIYHFIWEPIGENLWASREILLNKLYIKDTSGWLVVGGEFCSHKAHNRYDWIHTKANLNWYFYLNGGDFL